MSSTPVTGQRAPAIRRAAASDRERIEALLVASELPVTGVAEAIDHFVVAESGGALVGVAGLEVHGGDGVLRSVAVDEAFRGRGLGRWLAERIIEDAKGAGLRDLYLLTTTAEGWFPRLGFRRIARDHASAAVQRSIEFREACPASAAAMVLDLKDRRE